jgi:hypothetical protein
MSNNIYYMRETIWYDIVEPEGGSSYWGYYLSMSGGAVQTTFADYFRKLRDLELAIEGRIKDKGPDTLIKAVKNNQLIIPLIIACHAPCDDSFTDALSDVLGEDEDERTARLEFMEDNESFIQEKVQEAE